MPAATIVSPSKTAMSDENIKITLYFAPTVKNYIFKLK